jgi:hypothetical protein
MRRREGPHQFRKLAPTYLGKLLTLNTLQLNPSNAINVNIPRMGHGKYCAKQPNKIIK